MTLLAASKITKNDELRARTSAALRKVGAAKLAENGAPGQLARAAYIAPETMLEPFLLRVATNTDVTAAACESCGHVTTGDDTLEWIVLNAWDTVAAEQFPTPA